MLATTSRFADLIVAHDAGGAEILSALVASWPPSGERRFVLGGPAVSIFQRKINRLILSPESNLEQLVDESEFILTGSSWASDLELRAIEMAGSKGIKVACFLDHWGNYLERFQNRGRSIWPDEIWVGDEYAFKIASQVFPKSICIRLHPNPYFTEIRGHLAGTPSPARESADETSLRILYCTVPMIAQFGGEKQALDARGYHEFTAFRGFFEYLTDQANSSMGMRCSVRVRLHPSETPGKYDSLMQQFPSLSISMSNSPLWEDIAWADWVVGCDTMAMVVGVLADKKVVSAIPRGGTPGDLPFKEIVHLFSNN